MERPQNMASQRISTSSSGSRDSTAFDPQSAPSSPRSPNNGDPRQSMETQDSSSRITASSMASIKPQEIPSDDAPGWPRLARLMSKTPAFSAHSRFTQLNIKNLLYYQAELKNLEVQIIRKENEPGLDTHSYRQLVADADTPYHDLMMKLRELLREYNEAVLQHTQLCELPDPESFNLRALRTYLRPDGSVDFDIHDMKGEDQTWGDPDPEHQESSPSLRANFWVILKALIWAQSPVKEDLDLVVTHPQNKIDGLTRWVVYYLIPFWWAVQERWRTKKISRKDGDEEKAEKRRQSKNKPDSKSDTLESFSEATALRFTSALSTVVACLIPVIAIAVLTQVSGTRNLLLCITGFAVVFAILLIMLTQGTTSRTEIFAATAAFSAVLVVFISQPDIKIEMPPGAETPVINL